MRKEIEPEHKGCLILVGVMALAAIGMYISIEIGWPYLKNLLLLSSGVIGTFVGERYFKRPEKQTSWQTYLWMITVVLIATGLLTWLLED